MFNKAILKSLLVICCSAALTSCGGGPGGGVTEFKTVRISPSPKMLNLETDVITGNTCTTGGVTSGNGTIVTDSVDIEFASDLYPGVASGLPVRIDSYSVRFEPNLNPGASTSPPPALPTIPYTSIGQEIPAGGTLTYPVVIAQDALKSYILKNNIINACDGTIYSYYAIITFEGIEIGTGTRRSIGPVSINVAFADRVK
ncbi:hypothetical protein [Geotalea sp. SG265]|uniref:hypothetical protein n=1 Tax=Geotalea sp. SG265 TaxID=2922867 RepID=UPI001FAFE718|nr:hypothetical protein [Geotalea sp. SG265]